MILTWQPNIEGVKGWVKVSSCYVSDCGIESSLQLTFTCILAVSYTICLQTKVTKLQVLISDLSMYDVAKLA